MEMIGLLFTLGGIALFLVTALGYTRSEQALVNCLREEFYELWVSLGKPEKSIFQPASSLKISELVFGDGSKLRKEPKLAALHSIAKKWLLAFGFNMAVVFIGIVLIGANS